MPVITGAAAYPVELEQKIAAAGARLDPLDALALAEQAGSPKAVNLVLLGRFSRSFDFTLEEWFAAMEQRIPEKFLAMNRRAFLLGRDA